MKKVFTSSMKKNIKVATVALAFGVMTGISNSLIFDKLEPRAIILNVIGFLISSAVVGLIYRAEK